MSLFNTDKIVSNQDVETIISAIAKVLANNRKDYEQHSEEMKTMVEEAIKDVLEKYDISLSQLSKLVEDNQTLMDEKVSARLQTALTSVNSAVEHIKQTKPKDGKDADETKIVEAVLQKIKLPEYKQFILTGEDVVDSINALPVTEENQIPVERIKGLKELINKKPVYSGGIAGRDLFKDIDISASLDGSTKTFNIPAVWNILTVNLSSFPYGALRKGIDFTWTPSTITFTSAIDAATQLAAGQTCILTAVVG